MPEEFSIKGVTILSKFKFVEEQFGTASLEKFQSALQEKKIPMILTAGWYPFSIFNQVLEQISKDFYNGDITKLEEVGAHSARSSLQSVYRTFLQQKGFMSFLARIPALHKMFYSHGELKVEPGEDEKSCRIIIVGQPVITDADIYVASGFYKQAAELHGIKLLKHNFRVEDRVITHFLSWS